MIKKISLENEGFVAFITDIIPFIWNYGEIRAFYKKLIGLRYIIMILITGYFQS